MLVGGFNKEESQEYSKYCAILFYIDVKIVRHFIPLICDARPRVDRTPGHGRWELSYRPIRCPGNEDMIASELTPGTFLGSGKTSLFVRVANWEALMCKLQSSSCWKYLPPIDTEFGSALRRQMRRVLFSTLPPHLDFALPQSSHPPPDVLSSSVSVTIACR